MEEALLINGGGSSSRRGNSNKAVDLLKATLAEVFGCFVLMFSVACLSATGETGLLNYAVTAAFCICTIILTIGDISGAHVNPAITLAFAVKKNFPWSLVPIYAMAQVLGATLGTLAAKFLYNLDGNTQLAVNTPFAGPLRSLVMEVLMTSVMVFLACTISSAGSQLAGPAAALGIPATVGLSVMVASPISGGSLNPARSLGPAIVANTYNGIWIYVLGPCTGALIGALVHKGFA